MGPDDPRFFDNGAQYAGPPPPMENAIPKNYNDYDSRKTFLKTNNLPHNDLVNVLPQDPRFYEQVESYIRNREEIPYLNREYIPDNYNDLFLKYPNSGYRQHYPKNQHNSVDINSNSYRVLSEPGVRDQQELQQQMLKNNKQTIAHKEVHENKKTTIGKCLNFIS